MARRMDESGPLLKERRFLPPRYGLSWPAQGSGRVCPQASAPSSQLQEPSNEPL